MSTNTGEELARKDYGVIITDLDIKYFTKAASYKDMIKLTDKLGKTYRISSDDKMTLEDTYELQHLTLSIVMFEHFYEDLRTTISNRPVLMQQMNFTDDFNFLESLGNVMTSTEEIKNNVKKAKVTLLNKIVQYCHDGELEIRKGGIITELYKKWSGR